MRILGVRRFVIGAALVGLLASPAAAQTGPIEVRLTTTHERVCDAALAVAPQFDPMGVMAPLETPSQRGLRISALPDGGFTLRQWTREPAGAGVLTTQISNAGEVRSARLEGPLAAAMQAQLQGGNMAAVAEGLARDIPERLVVGRRYAVGAPYYDPATQQHLVDTLARGMGLPFPLDADIQVLFVGDGVSDEGFPIWVWEGPLSLHGEGVVSGARMAVTADVNFRITHDPSTGLVRTSEMQGEFVVRVHDEPTLIYRMRDAFTCAIVPLGEAPFPELPAAAPK